LDDGVRRTCGDVALEVSEVMVHYLGMGLQCPPNVEQFAVVVMKVVLARPHFSNRFVLGFYAGFVAVDDAY
jgi:hypothetical protein